MHLSSHCACCLSRLGWRDHHWKTAFYFLIPSNFLPCSQGPPKSRQFHFPKSLLLPIRFDYPAILTLRLPDCLDQNQSLLSLFAHRLSCFSQLDSALNRPVFDFAQASSAPALSEEEAEYPSFPSVQRLPALTPLKGLYLAPTCPTLDRAYCQKQSQRLAIEHQVAT